MSEEQPAQNSTPEDGVDQNLVTTKTAEAIEKKWENSPEDSLVKDAVGELAGVTDKHAEALEELKKENDNLKTRLEALESQIQKPESPVESSTVKSLEDTEHQPDPAESRPDATESATKSNPDTKQGREIASEKSRHTYDYKDGEDELTKTEELIFELENEIKTKEANGEDVTKLKEDLSTLAGMRDYYRVRDYRDKDGNIHSANPTPIPGFARPGQFVSKEEANNRPAPEKNPDNPQPEQTDLSVEPAESENPDSQPGQENNPEVTEVETAETSPEEAQLNPEASEIQQQPEHLEASTSPEAVVNPGELSPAEQESAGNNPEQNGIIEVPPIDPGDYPDLYARRKNLVGGDKEKLEADSKRLAQEMTANVDARVHNFIIENPDATPEQIRQFSVQCYVESQNKIQEDVINAIDGVGYTDANGELKGRSRLRRFGAWLDRNSGKIKKTMLVVGVVGAVALTAGIATGVIVPAFAIGAGTAIGAAKGATIGLGMSRHGSKESAARKIDVTSEQYRQLFAEMSPGDNANYSRISDYIMQQFNSSAETDHVTNVKKSRRAAIVGAVIGAIAGSVSFTSAQAAQTTQTVQVPNSHPPIPHHTIQSGELTGQVINKTLSQMGIDGSKFVNSDGSTNLQAIYGLIPKDQWQSMEAMANGTHSVAGADSLSNEGIRRIIEAVVSNHDWGTHAKTIEIVATQSVPNVAATIAGYVTAAILAVSATRKASDLVKPPRGGSTAPTGERSIADGLQKNKTYTVRVNGTSVLARYTGRLGDTFSFTNDSNGQKYKLSADQLSNIVSR